MELSEAIFLADLPSEDGNRGRVVSSSCSPASLGMSSGQALFLWRVPPTRMVSENSPSCTASAARAKRAVKAGKRAAVKASLACAIEGHALPLACGRAFCAKERSTSDPTAAAMRSLPSPETTLDLGRSLSSGESLHLLESELWPPSRARAALTACADQPSDESRMRDADDISSQLL